MGMFTVALGGACGAMLRYALSWIIGSQHMFPWATLTINIAGSFAIGLVWGVCGQMDWFQSWGRLFLVVGLLGGFTTFSAFSLETLTLVNDGKVVAAFGYVASSVVLCLVAVWVGERASQIA